MAPSRGSPKPIQVDTTTTFSPSLLTPIISSLTQTNNLHSAITHLFSLPPNDTYTYHAHASVTLSQAQSAIDAGRANGLHDFYVDPSGSPLHTYPPTPDIDAYTACFDPAKSPLNTLKSFSANAKKGSLREASAAYLLSKYYLHPSIPTPPRHRTPFPNPYYAFWLWSCHALEYAGPTPTTALVTTSHHILPVFMHHFGCVCPSYTALALIASLSRGRTILDLGSGSGYWALMLRRMGCTVLAVDNAESVYRCLWIEDTIRADAVSYLRDQRVGGRGDVLLLVYPVVSGEFARRVIDEYRGELVCVAGTQNGNGYTGFRDRVVDEWMMGEERRGVWEIVVRVPLPSFAGKDDALFIFRRIKKEDGPGG